MANSKTWKAVSFLFCILSTFISILHAEEVRLVTIIDSSRPPKQCEINAFMLD